MPSVKSGTRRPGRCWQVRDWKTVRWAIRWSYSPRPRPVCVGVRVPPSGSWPPTRASPSRRLARSPRWATTGSPAPYTRFTRPWTAMLSSPRRRVGWRRRPTSSARGERGFSRRPSCAPSSPQKASQVCLLRVTSHARAVRVAFSPSRRRSAEVKPRPPAGARLLRGACFSSRSLRYFLVDLLSHLRRRSLHVQDSAPRHKDGRGLRGSSHFDPQWSVVLQKERSGYGFRLAPDQLGGFILIEIGAGHVSDEDPVPQPLRKYRRTRRRSPFLFHLLPPWRRDIRPKRAALGEASRLLQNIHVHAGPGHGRCAESRGRLGHHDIGRDDEGADGGGVLERRTGDHRRVYDASPDQILVLAG